MPPRPSITWTRVTLDCSDAEALALFYTDFLGWEVSVRDGAGWAQLSDPHGGVGLNFQADDSYEPPPGPRSRGYKRR